MSPTLAQAFPQRCKATDGPHGVVCDQPLGHRPLKAPWGSTYAHGHVRQGAYFGAMPAEDHVTERRSPVVYDVAWNRDGRCEARTGFQTPDDAPCTLEKGHGLIALKGRTFTHCTQFDVGTMFWGGNGKDWWEPSPAHQDVQDALRQPDFPDVEGTMNAALEQAVNEAARPYSPTVHVAIGNSDDRLTQVLWSRYVDAVDRMVRAWAKEVHGQWFSAPGSQWQNAIWAFVLHGPQDVDRFRQRLREIAEEFGQDSIAWNESETVFIQPVR